jgi:hypothetical protein
MVVTTIAAQARDSYRQQRRSQTRQPQGWDDDRGFLDRAGDEVRFGDEEAERRRERDARQSGGASGGYGRDEHYHQ